MNNAKKMIKKVTNLPRSFLGRFFCLPFKITFCNVTAGLDCILQEAL